MITQELLKSFAHYDPSTGKLTKKRFTYEGWVDEEMGCIEIASRNSHLRYKCCEILGKKYRVHRLIWLYMTGEWPEYIDHIDGDGTNNKWGNLRDVRPVENSRNRKLNKNSTTGIPGVSWITSRNEYRVAISVDGKKKTIGYAKELEKAREMRKSAELICGYHENHGRAA